MIGHRNTVGRPALWATTEAFLTDLQLGDLTELPPLTELGELVLPELMDTPPTGDEEEVAETEAEVEIETEQADNQPLLN